MKWDYVRLGDVCSKIGSGATPKGGATVYINKGTSLIRSQNVYNLFFLYDGLAYITENAAKALAGVTVHNNDILINITGDSVARTCMVPDNVLPARVNQHVAIVRPNSNLMNPRFLNYYLASPYMQSFMLGLAVGKGASRNAMTKEMIAKFDVPCPPIDVQESIVDILSKYDSLIENNQKQIKLLEEAAQRLYKEWFVDLRFPGHETTQIVDGVPKGWSYANLKEIADVVMGQSPKSEFYNNKNQGLPFHQGVGSYGDRFVIDNTYSTSYTRIAKENSILFSVRAPVGRMNITKNQVVIGRGLASIIHKKGLQSFLFYQLKDMFYKDNLVGNGSIFASISKNELLQLKLLVPSFELVKKYNDIISVIDKRIENIDNQKNLAQEARDRLLPKLMNGEIEV